MRKAKCVSCGVEYIYVDQDFMNFIKDHPVDGLDGGWCEYWKNRLEEGGYWATDDDDPKSGYAATNNGCWSCSYGKNE